MIVDDASLLDTTTLTELHQTALVARVQVWLLVDTADRPPAGKRSGRHDPADSARWVNNVCTVRTPRAGHGGLARPRTASPAAARSIRRLVATALADRQPRRDAVAGRHTPPPSTACCPGHGEH